MLILALTFVSGAWALQQMQVLPSLQWGWGLLALLLITWYLRRHRYLRLLSLGLLGFLAGVFWAALMANLRLADELPHAWEGKDIQLIGVVASMPSKHERGERFDFDVEQVLTAGAIVPGHISLMQYHGGFAANFRSPQPSLVPVGKSASELHAGERWKLTVRLKRPHGTSNPHGYDFELWALEQNIRASGYIRLSPLSVRLDEFVHGPAYWIEAVREKIRQRMDDVLQGQRYAGVLKALAIGDDSAISQNDWQVFRRTGIVHLVSISGLHITMLAGMLYAMVYQLWCRIPKLVLHVPARKAAVIAGALTALAYSLVAGFSVPTQRTLFMLVVFALALWSGRQVSIARVLSVALLVVVLMDPWAVMAAGFWLSFGAVALIAYVMAGRLQRSHWLRDAIVTQWAVTLGLIPPLLVLFQQFSLISPVANAFAIPLVSLVIVPLTLLGSLLPLDWALDLAYWVMQLAMKVLIPLSDLPAAVWEQYAPPAWALLLSMLGVLWILLPRGFPLRWFGVVLILPLLMIAPSRPLPGDMRVTVLDVGQGLAVMVQTATHAMLYDTGPRYSADSDAGNKVVVPYLRGEGVSKLNGMVVSHDDLDHTGGLPSILAEVPIDWVLSSLPEDKAELERIRRLSCHAGQTWLWDGVRFEILYPAEGTISRQKTNNRSCVLRIQSAAGSILLPGDIERGAENELLDRVPQQLPTDIMIAPHHGSKTSSIPRFVNETTPKAVIFAMGYRNRFNHPRPEVVARYEALGAISYRSDWDGAVIMDFKQEQGIVMTRWREKVKRYWHDEVADFTSSSLAETGYAR
ncbi:DNA internalization-related competence protein ComEC/Rec2 [Methylobacillus caricis]|uniref:DNA internalization-related competence protein ComEC/Rec2 n=1 Tax=Methylobacillus caricis TaxID=1971611 RepID=UPI001CFFD8BC|nr:DNA internalization-related competence protein ComEC/Rec2 [Methylobacillus caricis]MCB5188418.1 DNA internalization-related competence protein ComEC/Rec2 [Methylobacillus caricis]